MRGEVPDGWSLKRLTDVADIRKGRIVKTTHEEAPASLPYIGAAQKDGPPNRWTTDSTAVVCEPADSLILWDGERSGLAWGGQAGAVSSTVARVRPKKAVLHGPFLTACLDSAFGWIQARRTGTGVPHVPKDLGRILRVPLPPLPEQRKIAAILSSVDEAIAATEAVIAQTRRVKEGLLQDLLTRGIGRGGRPHTRFKQTEIGEIPESWEVRRLGEVLSRGLRNGISPATAAIGVPSFSIAAVRNGRIDIFSNLKFADIKQEETTQFRISSGDLLLIRGNGNPELVGTAGLVGEFPEGCIYPDILMRLVAAACVLPKFLLYTINSSAFHIRLLRKAATTNGTWKVNGKTVGTMRLALPPIDEQAGIVERIDVAEASEAEASQALTSLRQTKAGLLQDLLTGKVRVSV